MPASKKNILNKTMWFTRRARFDDLDYRFFDIMKPQRVVSEDRRYNSGEFRSEKCGRNIQYESGQELKFFQQLENNPDVLLYWEQPVKIPYRKGKRRLTYTPDVAIFTVRHEIIIAEVKSLSEMLDNEVQAKTEGLMEFCSRRGFGLLLTDGSNTPEILGKGKINRNLEKELAEATRMGTIRRAQYKQIREKCHATPGELYRAIIRLGLKYTARSFKLRCGNQSPVFRQVYFGRKKYDQLVIEKFSNSGIIHPPESHR